MGLSTLGLEEHFDSLPDGSLITLKADIIIFCPGATMCKSAIFGQNFITDVQLDLSLPNASLINVRLARIGGKVWLLTTDETAIIQRPQLTLDGVANIVEACSGIGAVGKGFYECGADTIAFCDYNAKFCEWLKRRNDIPVIHGNIAHMDTICQIDEAIGQRSHVLHGGVACQPFSKLGDEKQGMDSRSESFTGLLKAGFHLGSLMIIMECTPSALTSQWGQDNLREFAQQTGFVLHQSVIDLQACWPSKRQRWWAVLTHPQLPCAEIPPLPSFDWVPTVFHLMPRMKSLTPEEVEQLSLDLYELRHFHEAVGGISKSVFNPYKPMPTATHSWGSQVKGCHCQCRSSGFSEARLASKGLYGVVIPLGNITTNGNNTYHQMRHPHPEEVALLNGLFPKDARVQESETLRLALAGVGQLASPIQSAWIYSNALWNINKAGIDINIDHPRRILASLCRKLLRARDELLGDPPKTRYMSILEKAIDAIDRPKTFAETEEEDFHFTLTQAIHQKCIEVEAVGVVNDRVEISNCQNPVAKGKGGYIPKNAPDGDKNLEKKITETRPETVPETDESQKLWADDSQRVTQNKRMAYTETGGMIGFESNKKPTTDTTQQEQAQSHEQSLGLETITPTLQWEAVEHESKEQQFFPPDEIKHISVKVGYSMEKLHQVKCSSMSTIGQIAVAESKLQQIAPPTLAKTPVGSHLSASSIIEAGQIIILHDGQVATDDKCPAFHCLDPPNLNGIPRVQSLWYQRGWVATDEMEFYLQQLNAGGHAITAAPLIIPNHPDASLVMCSWILRAFEIAAAADNAYNVCTACLWKQHWIPIHLQINEQETSITTTSDNHSLVQQLVTATYPDIVIYTSVSRQAFPADCGFQAVAWIQNQIHEKLGTPKTTFPMTPEIATEHRKSFETFLVNNHNADRCVTGLLLGGMGDNVIGKLQQLLENHGVNPHRSENCAQMLVKELGHSNVQKTLTSPEPWRDLKAKANAQSPPIKIVLAEELKAVIDEKITSGHQFGRKANKKQGQRQANPGWKGLGASQVQIPSNVFKQEDGTLLDQIHVQQFHQHAAGVAVVNIQDALPFFSLDRHLSQEGLGLIILDHHDSRIPECKQIIRFPANCPETEEPMLVTAALLQLGKKQVLRNTPEKCTSVEEIRTLVVRALVYKDQYKEQQWSDFVKSPVKHLLTIKEFREQPDQTVLDVWDRQYLNKQFQKTKPQEADMFVVAIRIKDTASAVILAASGNGGIYFEPRTDSGRSPLPTYGVVWMPRKLFSEVMLAKQTSTYPTWIVRSGDRYGLRVEEQYIPDLHKEHRPDIEYLEGQSMVTYRVGPMPYGTTKPSLQKVFREWNWKARAGQPQGQDTNGVMWTAQATEPPSHWVFTLSHGDVLITKQQSSKDKSYPITHAPLTSHRTMQHLTATSNRKAWDKQQQDPWAHDDPWSQWSSSKAGPGISPAQISTIENTVEKRILAQLPVPVAKSEDMELEPDVHHRVNNLEAQVQHLKETVQQASASMQSFQHQQAQQNQQLSQQVHAVKHQVDTQHHHLQSMIEGKLEEQMGRIESLLTKRMKTNE